MMRGLVLLIILASCNGAGKPGAPGSTGNAQRIPGFTRIGDTIVTQWGHEYKLRFSDTGDTDETGYSLSVYRDGEICLSRDFYMVAGVGFAEFMDFDGDSLCDILLHWSDNDVSDNLYLFLADSSSFREVAGFASLEGARPVKGAKDVYYAYSSHGCPELEWGSDLFTIRDFQLIGLASMYVQECHEPYEAEISKVVGEESVFVERIPYIPYEEDNGKLMTTYWDNNWKKFMGDQISP